MILLLLYAIPFIVSGIVHYFYKNKITTGEIILMFVTPTAIVGIIHIALYHTSITDYTETKKLVKYVEYFEPWETYVDKTCETCTTDSKGKRSCTTYDCSYCDDYSEKYNVVFFDGYKQSINRNEYEYILNEYTPNKPKFRDLHRKINKSFMCGFDGDSYVTTWNGKIEKSITKSQTSYFKNPILINQNAYNFKEYDDEYLIKKGFYNTSNYLSNRVYGIDLLDLPSEQKEIFERYVDYENSKLAEHNFSQFYFFFTKKPISHVIEQKSIMLNGKNNQMIIFIGIGDKNKINYVYPYSWSKNKSTEVNIKYDIMKLLYIDNPNKLVNIAKSNMQKFEVRNMEDFNYLSYSLSTEKLTFLFLTMIIISAFISLYCVMNEYDDDDNYRKRYK